LGSGFSGFSFYQVFFGKKFLFYHFYSYFLFWDFLSSDSSAYWGSLKKISSLHMGMDWEKLQVWVELF